MRLASVSGGAQRGQGGDSVQQGLFQNRYFRRSNARLVEANGTIANSTNAYRRAELKTMKSAHRGQGKLPATERAIEALVKLDQEGKKPAGENVGAPQGATLTHSTVGTATPIAPIPSQACFPGQN